MKTVTINPSVAAIVNIDGIGLNENVPIYLTAPVAWIGSFSFQLFNSDKKNNQIDITEVLSIDNNVMTITISPISLSIPAGSYYYEIINIDEKRILFKGSLNIIK